MNFEEDSRFELASDHVFFLSDQTQNHVDKQIDEIQVCIVIQSLVLVYFFFFISVKSCTVKSKFQ